jgi:TetR/AcrR family transcriptional repressor of nem operon
MARTRAFCPNDALDKAMRVFWAKGYVGTSIDDLVQATGVSRYGLYGEFGDKNGLFLAALAHYQENIARPLLNIVEQPNASLAEVRRLFELLAEFASQQSGTLGCLIFNSIHEIGFHDAATADTIQHIRERLATGLQRMLQNAVANGELAADFDVRREADFLFGVLHALPMMARAGATPETLRNIVSVSLATLE